MDDDGNPYFIAIGASGSEGLHDIIDVLRALPRPLFAVVMVVLHRPSEGISHSQQVLSRSCPMPVIIAQETESMEPGVCYIGEPDGHLILVERNLAHLVPGSKNRLRNRTIDTLFNSLATHASGRITGVVLSGLLDDGSRGLATIHHAGGLTMVLDPGIKPRGMQQNAIDYDGPISFVGDAKAIARAVGRALSEKLLPLRR